LYYITNKVLKTYSNNYNTFLTILFEDK